MINGRCAQICDLAHWHQLRCKDFDRAIELLEVEQPLGGVANRIAVLELEVAEARLKRLCAKPSMGPASCGGFIAMLPFLIAEFSLVSPTHCTTKRC
jgi:hypothetical protein